MNYLRNIFAFLIIPPVLAAGYTFADNFFLFAANIQKQYIPFLIGIVFYIVFQIIFYKPMKTYVFGHELSHAIAGIISGARIKKFHVGNESGSVVLTKDNIWITLAPYIFPIYTIMVVVIYYMLGWFCEMEQLRSYFLFFVGLTIAFHIALTIHILGISQPDLKVYGKFFSYVAIFALNILIFSLLFILIFPYELEPKNYFMQMFQNIVNSYIFIFKGAKEIWLAFQKTS